MCMLRDQLYFTVLKIKNKKIKIEEEEEEEEEEVVSKNIYSTPIGYLLGPKITTWAQGLPLALVRVSPPTPVWSFWTF